MNKNKLKKILTTTLVSAVSVTAIGCSSSNNKLAKNIDKSMAEFVSSINNLDYVDTSVENNFQNDKVGKIVETSTTNQLTAPATQSINSSNNQEQFFNNQISNLNVENTITRPSERSDNFKLFTLSESPFISFSSDDNSASFHLSMKFSTDKIEETSDEINTKINTLILKRSILMIYVNEIYNGNVNLSDENKVAINAYVNVIKENTSFLNGNRGMVKNQLSLASDLVSTDTNGNLINYYIIKSGEALETRASKIDSSISAIDSIINIIEANLSASSNYYNSNLSSTYDNLIFNLKNEQDNSSFTSGEITQNSTNKEIAHSIANSLNFTKDSFELKTSTNDNSNAQQITINNHANTLTPNQNSNLVANSQNNSLTNSLNNTVNNQNNLRNNTSNLNTTDNSRNNNTLLNNNSNQITNMQNNIQQNTRTGFIPSNTNSRQNHINNQTSNNSINRNLTNRSNLNNPQNENANQNNFINGAQNNQRSSTQNNTIQNNTTNEHTSNNESVARNRNRINRRIIRNRNRVENNQNNNTNNNQNQDNNVNNSTRIIRHDRDSRILDTNTNKPNSAKSVTNMLDNKEYEEKILRADRTPENATKEEFQSTSLSSQNKHTVNEASRMPFRTNETN